MSLSKKVYKLLQYNNLINEIKGDLYCKLIELKSIYPVYLSVFNKQCIINNVKIKDTESGKWFIVEFINEVGNVEYLKIPENLTKLKSIEYEYLKDSILNGRNDEAITKLLNSKHNIFALYPKKANKDKQLKAFTKKYLN